MDALKRWCRQVWTRAGSMSWRARCTFTLLAGMIVVGGVLLVGWGGADDERVALWPEPLPADQAVAVRLLLDEREVDYRVVAGRLMVRRDQADRARAMLETEGIGGTDLVSRFERLAKEDNIWRSGAQNDRRWQVAKMAALSGMIGNFPSVRRATVILEPGRPRKLGTPAVAPTAAVHVIMEDDSPMGSALAQSIADLVAGSVAGMKAEDVRIVDSTGRSYRCGGGAARPPAVVVDAAPPSGGRAPAGSVKGARGDGGTDPAGELQSRWPVRKAAGIAVGVLLAGGAAWLVLSRRKGRRRAPADQEARAGAPEGAEARDGDHDSGAEESQAPPAFDFLRDMSPQELAACLNAEHPQTLAVILAHLPSDKAAAVLAVLGEDKQVEVACRLVDLGQIDAEIVAEIERTLSSRLSGGGGDAQAFGGMTVVAQILHHAGYATEKTVIEALEDRRPTVAEGIRRRLFVFEDLARMPAGQLRQALSGFEYDELAVALRTAGKELSKKLLSCLPTRAAKRVRREMSRIGPVRLSDVEAAQQRVVDAVRRLAEGTYVAQGAEKASGIIA